MRPQAFSTSRAWGIFCVASTAESGINRWTGYRRFLCPILLEIGREAVAGFAREELLREAAAQSKSRPSVEEIECSS